jgi:beta-lactamase regulating signal transducer with metallopeptidase domain
VNTLSSFVVGNALMATLMALAVAVLARLCRRPALAHGLWILVLMKLITPSFWPVPLQRYLTSEVPQAHSETDISREQSRLEVNAVPVLEEPGNIPLPQPFNDVAEPVASAGPELAMQADAQPAPARMPPVAETINPEPTPRPIPWTALSMGVWLGGSLCWLVLASARLMRFRRFLSSGQVAPADLQLRVRHLAGRLGLKRPPQVLVLPAAVSPMLWASGGAPRLLLPAALLDQLSHEQWDTLLVHELAHLRRRDHWVRWLEFLVLALNWWHPVAWWARRELREAEEQCCDAWVVWALPALAEAYALALVETVTFLSRSRSALPLGASGIGQVQLLKRRLIMIMRGTTPKALSGLGLLALLGLGALLLPLLPTWAQSDEPPPAADEAPAAALPPQAERGAPPDPALAPVAAPPGPAGVAFDMGFPVAAQPPAGSGGRAWGATRAANAPAEALEDARDEVELLAVQLESKRAELNEVQALRRQAQRTAARTNRLVQSGNIDSAEADKARTELEVIEARLGGKQAQIREAEVRLRQAQRHLARLQGAERPRRETPPGSDAANAVPPGLPAGVGRFGGSGVGRPPSGAIAPPSHFPPGSGQGSDDNVPATPHAGAGAPGMRMGGMAMPGMPGMSGKGGYGAGGTEGGPGMRPGMAGGMMGGGGGAGMMAGPGGMAAGSRSTDLNRRLDTMERRLDALLKDVKSLKDLANAQAQQEKLLQDLLRELKQLRKNESDREARP